jgi:tetratricopeptide (TPR) repeat protein
MRTLLIQSLLLSVLILIGSNLFAQKTDTTAVDQLYNKSKSFWYSSTDSAIYYLNQSLSISEEIKYTRGKAYALYGLGNVDRALFKQFQFLTQSLALFEDMHDDFGIGLNLVKIGFVYERLGEKAKAFDYYQRALEVKKKVNDTGGIALCLINIGIIYNLNGDVNKALDLFQQSLVYRHKIGNKQGIAYAQLNIGEALDGLNRPDEALIWADSSILNFATTPDVQGYERALFLSAQIHKQKNENDEAIAVYKKMIDISSPLVYNYHVLQARKALVKYFEDKNDIKNAFAQQSIYLRLKDSLDANDYRVQTQKIANEFEFKNAVEAEARQKQEADRKLARKNTLEYLGLSVIVFMVFALIFATRKRIGNSNVILLLSLLLLFEFLLVLTDPFVDVLTSGDPILKLLANFVLALVILPAHKFLENFIQRRVFVDR